MKTIYLNENFECSVKEKPDTMRTVETDVFDNKCNAYIEGYRFVPEGATWTRSDGVLFSGQMVAPFKDSQMLDSLQSLFEETNGVTGTIYGKYLRQA